MKGLEARELSVLSVCIRRSNFGNASIPRVCARLGRQPREFSKREGSLVLPCGNRGVDRMPDRMMRNQSDS